MSDKCAKTYTAYTNGAGPECGKTYTGTYYTYYLCEPGDYCLSSSQKSCRKYQTPAPGDVYHAWTNAGGPECGKTYTGTYYTYYYCRQGDYCDSSTQKTCHLVGNACDATYHAYKNAGGPECGKVYTGTFYTYFYCQAGDYCNNSTQKACLVRKTCGPGSIYTAFANAGGPECGKVYSGSYYTYFYCYGGDTCVSSTQRTCRR